MNDATPLRAAEASAQSPVPDHGEAWAWLRPGAVVSAQDISVRLGGRPHGGIRQAVKSRVSMLFLYPEDAARFGIHLGWDDRGLFHFPGEGSAGDQELMRGNKSIAIHRDEGRPLLVFQQQGEHVRVEDSLFEALMQKNRRFRNAAGTVVELVDELDPSRPIGYRRAGDAAIHTASPEAFKAEFHPFPKTILYANDRGSVVEVPVELSDPVLYYPQGGGLVQSMALDDFEDLFT